MGDDLQFAVCDAVGQEARRNTIAGADETGQLVRQVYLPARDDSVGTELVLKELPHPNTIAVLDVTNGVLAHGVKVERLVQPNAKNMPIRHVWLSAQERRLGASRGTVIPIRL